MGCVALGNINQHRIWLWLKHSTRNSLEGQELCAVCKDVGPTQLVHAPTRVEHLLVSVPDVKTEVRPLSSDKKPVTALGAPASRG